MSRSRVWLIACLFAVVTGAPPSSPAQTPEQVRLAFRSIRNDDIPWNAGAASKWLFLHRDRLTRELLDELYRTDRQGRDVIFSTLISTTSFQPDERFCRALVSRLNEEDSYVGYSALGIATHWSSWEFCNAHYDQFKSILAENAQTTNDMWCLWGTVSLWHKRGELADRLRELSPHAWELMARSLQDDKFSGNAGQAVRVYLIIGKAAIPRLESLKKSDEAQTRDYASAVIDAMNGSRRAYGYLTSQVSLYNMFSGGTGAPDWVSEELDKWDPHGAVRQRYAR